jgi:hypothetical protein
MRLSLDVHKRACRPLRALNRTFDMIVKDAGSGLRVVSD